MHGIQTSGNCIRNITSDERAGIAVDEIADPRPFCEIMRQWSTLHPEFAFLPRKFKIAVTGAAEDRAATGWHDVGLHLVKNEAGELGFRVLVGGGMGRTPVIGTVIREFLPWDQILNYLEAVVRVYNRYGRRDNMYKARIKILVKAEGQRYIDEVEAEYKQIVEVDGAPHTITQAELDRVAASFVPPALAQPRTAPRPRCTRSCAPAPRPTRSTTAGCSSNVAAAPEPRAARRDAVVQAPGPGARRRHRRPAGHRRRAGRRASRPAKPASRTTRTCSCPGCTRTTCPSCGTRPARPAWPSANIGLLTDMIACPGGDFCSLANARSLPDRRSHHASATRTWTSCTTSARSTCTSPAASTPAATITAATSASWASTRTARSGTRSRWAAPTAPRSPARRTPGKVVGPSFSAAEVPEVIEAVLDTYRRQRQSVDGKAETFIDHVRASGIDPFKAAANAARFAEKQVA